MRQTENFYGRSFITIGYQIILFVFILMQRSYATMMMNSTAVDTVVLVLQKIKNINVKLSYIFVPLEKHSVFFFLVFCVCCVALFSVKL